MKRNLSALALLASLAGTAFAQSNVTIYGIVDNGFIKETGSDITMGQNVLNRIGFKGSEDLGRGYKATFQLEKRFTLNDGAPTGVEWDGAANVGIAGPFGAVRLGRVNELPTETFRKLDPFNQESVGSMLLGSLRSARISNTIRYDSPNFSGFRFGASYSLGENTDKDSRNETGNRLKLADADNDGYAISLKYANGPLYAVANWSRLADSNDSAVWNLGAFYKFGPAKVSLGYEKTHDKGYKLGSEKALKESTQDNWILGLQYAIGAGRINASFNYMEIDHARDWDGTKDIKKYSLGYEYDLSKRTTLYAMISHSDFEDTELSHSVSGFYRKNKESDTIATNDHITGIQFGMTHRF